MTCIKDAKMLMYKKNHLQISQKNRTELLNMKKKMKKVKNQKDISKILTKDKE